MLAELDAPKPAPPKPAPPPAPKPAVKPAPDVLELTEAMAQPTPPPGPAPSFRTIDGGSDVVFADRAARSRASDRARALEEARARLRAEHAGAGRARCLSSTATARRSTAPSTRSPRPCWCNNARTLEDLVKEMLRPMLKAWLDDNLPGLVERIVRAEIERVSRGRP